MGREIAIKNLALVYASEFAGFIIVLVALDLLLHIITEGCNALGVVHSIKIAKLEIRVQIRLLGARQRRTTYGLDWWAFWLWFLDTIPS